ncbi:MAG: hypothetical protein AAF639_11560 [Chloroflexota bacterium]
MNILAAINQKSVKWLRINPYLILLFLLTIPAIAPLFAPGYFYDAHDGRHSVFYLSMFDASLRDGALWPRWAMHHIQGYGYPTFIIQAPLGFYFAELFVLLGAGYTLAAKWAWAVGFLLSGWGMYRLVVYWAEGLPERGANDFPQLKHHSPLSGRDASHIVHLAGITAGILYIYIPYHLVGIYVRAALNDTLLLAWFPWVFIAFDRLISQGIIQGWQRRFAIAALTLAGTLLTHTFALLSFAPFIVLFVLFKLFMNLKSFRAFMSQALLAGGAGIASLLLYACFLFPLLVEGPLLEQQVYVTDTYNFRNHFVYLGQFLNPVWGFGFSDDPTGVNDGMSFQIGVMAAFFVLVAGFGGLSSISRINRDFTKNSVSGTILYLLLATLLLVWMITPLSSTVWETFTPLAVIQFPWRLLSLAIFSISALTGLVIYRLSTWMIDNDTGAGGLVFLLLVIFASYSYIGANLQPVEDWREDGRAIFRFEQEHPDMIAYTQWVQEPFQTSPMTAEYAAETYTDQRGRTTELTRFAIADGDGEVLWQESRGSSMRGRLRVNGGDGTATVQIHVFYFPGWQVWVDGTRIEHRVSNPHGLVEVDVPADGNEHEVLIRMGTTPARRTGAIISWGMLVVLGLMVAWPVLRNFRSLRN